MIIPVMLPCRELGFTPVEVNASDTRNKADNNALKGMGGKLSNSIRELATNTAIGMDSNNKPKRVSSAMCSSTVAASTQFVCQLCIFSCLFMGFAHGDMHQQH